MTTPGTRTGTGTGTASAAGAGLATGSERRQNVLPRTVREVASTIAPWLAIYALLMLIQFLLVVLLDDMNVLRLTENARTAFRRFGDVRAVDGLFSTLTLLLTATGIGACVLTATLPHLRADDRHFASAIGVQFTLLGMEEQLQLHSLLGSGLRGVVLAFSLHATVAVFIGLRWKQRVLRVWPLILVAASALGTAIILDRLDDEIRILMYAEEWLELLGAVFLSGIAITLARQAIVDASRSRRFAQPPDQVTGRAEQVTPET